MGASRRRPLFVCSSRRTPREKSTRSQGEPQDLPAPHPRMECHRDDREEVRTLRALLFTGPEQPGGFVLGEEAEPPLRLPSKADLRHLVEIAPLLGEPPTHAAPEGDW